MVRRGKFPANLIEVRTGTSKAQTMRQGICGQTESWQEVAHHACRDTKSWKCLDADEGGAVCEENHEPHYEDAKKIVAALDGRVLLASARKYVAG